MGKIYPRGFTILALLKLRDMGLLGEYLETAEVHGQDYYINGVRFPKQHIMALLGSYEKGLLDGFL